MAVVDTGDGDAKSLCVTKQEAAPATDLEQTILRAQSERRQNRAARKVVHVVCAIDLTSPATSGSAGDAIGEPIIKPLHR
jgi:hypothetical protein